MYRLAKACVKRTAIRGATVIDGKVRLIMAKKETVFSLTAQKRDSFGKGASRRDRQNDRIPAVVYGNDQEPLHVSLDHHTASLALRVPYVTINLELDGKKFVVAPREIQKDASGKHKHPVQRW